MPRAEQGLGQSVIPTKPGLTPLPIQFPYITLLCLPGLKELWK